jgi:predicted transport protein
LEKAAKKLKKTLVADIVLWFAYSKTTSKVASDLTRDQGWKSLYDMGLQGVASIAIDNTWSGVRFRRGDAKTEDELIAKQYAGERAAFMPLYQQLSSLAHGLGQDVESVTRQSYVAFSKGKQFALIKPSRDRLDLGLKLPNAPLNARLQSASGVGSGSMTHRVAITKAGDIDSEVIGWLQDAYRAASK